MSEGTLPRAEADRDGRRAAWNGWRRRCPACGRGALFGGYLTVAAACPHCGEVLSHHRADDGPAYLTILIVGHLMAPLLILVWTQFRPDPLTMALGFSAGTVALSLWLLPRLKGVMVGIQWARRMYGFGGEA
jgi:uncharacterized protein (DUF983 family)